MNEFIIGIDYFLIYSMIGWLVESCYCSIFAKPKPHWINRGFLYGPYCPIYGFGACAVLLVLWPLANKPVLVFVVSIFLTSALEYFTSYILEKLFHTRWWDYSRYKLNINGRVCALNSFFFGCLSMILVYGIHPVINDFLATISLVYLAFITACVLMVFVFDSIITIIHLINLRKVIMELSEDLYLFKEDLSALAQLTSSKLSEKLANDPKYIKINQEIKPYVTKEIKIMKAHLANSFPQSHVVFNAEQIKKRLDKKINIAEKLERFKEFKEKGSQQ